MASILKIAHFLGLSVFLGSIPGHILLGRLADPAAGLQGFALLMHAKYITSALCHHSLLGLLNWEMIV